MRPTAIQVFQNFEYFCQLLEQAGEENVQARMSSLFHKISEWYSVDLWVKRYNTDMRVNQQLHQTHPRRLNYVRNKKLEIIRVKQRVALYRHSYLRYKQHADLLLKAIDKKIAKWPELEFNPKSLSTLHPTKLLYESQKKYAYRFRYHMI